MDIQKSQFPQEVVGIIQHVADSHFIAFDLEFSGIAGRRKAPPGGKRDKLTVQEMYNDLKEAAEKYQILQVGLTVVEEDKEKGENSPAVPDPTQSVSADY
jgi:poly(A)-specific ribonuclease